MGLCDYLGPDFKDKLVNLIKDNFSLLCNNPSGFIIKVIDTMKEKISAKLKVSTIPGSGAVRIAMEQTLDIMKTQAGLVAGPLQIALATPPAVAACRAGQSDTVMAVLKQAIDTSFTKICGEAAAKAIKEENAVAAQPVVAQPVAQPMMQPQMMQQPMMQQPMMQQPMMQQPMMQQPMMQQPMMQPQMMQQPMMQPQMMQPQMMQPQMMQQPMMMPQQQMMSSMPMMQQPMPMMQQPMPMAAAAAGGKRRRYRRKTRKGRKARKARKSRRTNLKA